MCDKQKCSAVIEGMFVYRIYLFVMCTFFWEISLNGEGGAVVLHMQWFPNWYSQIILFHRYYMCDKQTFRRYDMCNLRTFTLDLILRNFALVEIRPIAFSNFFVWSCIDTCIWYIGQGAFKHKFSWTHYGQASVNSPDWGVWAWNVGSPLPPDFHSFFDRMVWYQIWLRLCSVRISFGL